jgi:hypothetical protein
MSVLTVIKKIGDKVLSVVEWPFKHGAMLAAIMRDSMKNAPATRDAILGLVQRFEALGPDVLADLASKGLDFRADVQTLADVKALFSYFQTDFLPVVAKDFQELSADAQIAAASPTAAPADTAQATAASSPAEDAPQPGPGLHNVVPA